MSEENKLVRYNPPDVVPVIDGDAQLVGADVVACEIHYVLHGRCRLCGLSVEEIKKTCDYVGTRQEFEAAERIADDLKDFTSETGAKFSGTIGNFSMDDFRNLRRLIQ